MRDECSFRVGPDHSGKEQTTAPVGLSICLLPFHRAFQIHWAAPSCRYPRTPPTSELQICKMQELQMSRPSCCCCCVRLADCFLLVCCACTTDPQLQLASPLLIPCLCPCPFMVTLGPCNIEHPTIQHPTRMSQPSTPKSQIHGLALQVRCFSHCGVLLHGDPKTHPTNHKSQHLQRNVVLPSYLVPK